MLNQKRHSSLQYAGRLPYEPFNRSRIIELKQSHRNDLAIVYEQLHNKFDKETTRVKLDYSTPPFDDQNIIMLVKKEPINRLKSNDDKLPRKKITLPKFYGERFIINDTIYIHQKKTILNGEQEFQKLFLPKPTFEHGCILSDRNKQLINLCKKAEIQSTRVKPSQKDINSILLTNGTMDSQQLKRKRKIEEFKEILKQDQMNKKTKHKSLSNNKHVISNFNTFDLAIPDTNGKPENEQQLTDLPTNDTFQPQHTQRTIQCKSTLKPPLLKPLRVRCKNFNWKNALFPINNVPRKQVMKLFRRYQGVQQVVPPIGGSYKFYIGEGNNSSVIAKALKNRGFWTQVQSLEDSPNLVWTQQPLKKFQQVETVRNALSIHPKLPQITDPLKPSLVIEFLKFKNNEYFQTINKLFEPEIKTRLLYQVIRKFKSGGKMNQYQYLWESVSKYYQIQHQFDVKSIDIKMQNHVENSQVIGNKKDLLRCLCEYAKIFNQNVNDYIPETIHIEQQFQINNIEAIIQKQLPVGPWLVKPGESTNRGTGITVHTSVRTVADEVRKPKTHKNGEKQTYIIQRYIMPMLYNQRKFDIRMWVVWSGFQLWIYSEGYLRTSSKQFTLKNLNKYIHLTNDAVQSCSEDYGKYEPSNKLSFNEFQKYLAGCHPVNPEELSSKQNFFSQEIYPRMKQLAIKAFKIGGKYMNKDKYNFQLFGLDFLVDSHGKTWLIQVNSNPCLQVNCSLLARLVHNMVENMITLVVDPLFIPPEKKNHRQQSWNPDHFKFQLIYNAITDQPPTNINHHNQ